MSISPKTLLHMAGVPVQPGSAENSILIFIDFQKEYTEGNLPLEGAHAAVSEASKLLTWARKFSVPVIHVVHHGKAGARLFDPNGPMITIIDDLCPAGDEVTIVKSLPNSFASTALAKILDSMGRKELIVAGFMTHMCVSSTVRAAADLGYRCTVVAAACATRDLPDISDGIVDAGTLNRAALAALADRFSIVVPNVLALESSPNTRSKNS